MTVSSSLVFPGTRHLGGGGATHRRKTVASQPVLARLLDGWIPKFRLLLFEVSTVLKAR